MGDRQPLLEVRNLVKHFQRTRGLRRQVTGVVKAVDDVSFTVHAGETLALVGESGCGKTTTGRCIQRAVEPTSGQVLFHPDGGDAAVNVPELGRSELKEVMTQMGMIFQDPYSSLNPRMTIAQTIAEPFVIHGTLGSRREMEERVAELLRMVRLDPVYMTRYPHAFSGGQRQRIAIARALALMPKFIVADEPVSALDVSVQAQILELLQDLQQDHHFAYLFIAHNLAVVEYFSERIAVMYVGKIVELTSTRRLFAMPRHPYTEALFSAVPKPDPRSRGKRILLGGDIADPANPPSGCYFHPRCRFAQPICREQEPPLVEVGADSSDPHLARLPLRQGARAGRRGLTPCRPPPHDIATNGAVGSRDRSWPSCSAFIQGEEYEERDCPRPGAGPGCGRRPGHWPDGSRGRARAQRPIRRGADAGRPGRERRAAPGRGAPARDAARAGGRRDRHLRRGAAGRSATWMRPTGWPGS